MFQTKEQNNSPGKNDLNEMKISDLPYKEYKITAMKNVHQSYDSSASRKGEFKQYKHHAHYRHLRRRKEREGAESLFKGSILCSFRVLAEFCFL